MYSLKELTDISVLAAYRGDLQSMRVCLNEIYSGSGSSSSFRGMDERGGNGYVTPGDPSSLEPLIQTLEASLRGGNQEIARENMINLFGMCDTFRGDLDSILKRMGGGEYGRGERIVIENLEEATQEHAQFNRRKAITLIENAINEFNEGKHIFRLCLHISDTKNGRVIPINDEINGHLQILLETIKSKNKKGVKIDNKLYYVDNGEVYMTIYRQNPFFKNQYVFDHFILFEYKRNQTDEDSIFCNINYLLEEKYRNVNIQDDIYHYIERVPLSTYLDSDPVQSHGSQSNTLPTPAQLPAPQYTEKGTITPYYSKDVGSLAKTGDKLYVPRETRPAIIESSKKENLANLPPPRIA